MANTARMQMALAASAHLQSRVKAILSKVTFAVISEPAATYGHEARMSYAREILRQLDFYTSQLAYYLVERPNLANDNVTTSFDFDIGAVVTDATDAAIESQINADWNSLAGVPPAP